MATNAAHPASLARAAISTPTPKARAQCGSPARWDLCGGRAEPVRQGPSLPRQADFLRTSYGFGPDARPISPWRSASGARVSMRAAGARGDLGMGVVTEEAH